MIPYRLCMLKSQEERASATRSAAFMTLGHKQRHSGFRALAELAHRLFPMSSFALLHGAGRHHKDWRHPRT